FQLALNSVMDFVDLRPIDCEQMRPVTRIEQVEVARRGRWRRGRRSDTAFAPYRNFHGRSFQILKNGIPIWFRAASFSPTSSRLFIATRAAAMFWPLFANWLSAASL